MCLLQGREHCVSVLGSAAHSVTVRAHSLPGDSPPPASKVRLSFPDLSGVVVVGMAGLNTAVSHCLQGCLVG